MENADPTRHPLLPAYARDYCIENREALKKMRRLKDFTLGEVAREVGVTIAAVGFWETGHTSPTEENALAWLKVIDSEVLDKLNNTLTETSDCACSV